VVGAERAVGLVMSKIGVALWKPGQVERGMEKGSGKGHDVFRAGEHDGRITPRTTELAEMLSVVDGSLATDNLWGERWAKLSANAMGNPVQAMSGLGSLEIMSSEVGRAITIQLAAESTRVGLAAGYRVPKVNGAPAEQWADAGRRETYEALDRMLTPQSASTRNWRASMAQDVTKGRPTEIDYMNGHVVAQVRQRGVPTPVSAAVVEMIHEVERRERKPAAENIELTLRRAGV
jgi:2-dehydropantoate 2-reductase